MYKTTFAAKGKKVNPNFTKLRAYKNNEETKAKCVASVAFLDRKLHNTRGTTIAEGKHGMQGCISQIGSTESELGLPDWLLGLAESLYQNIPYEQHQEFVEDLLAAIEPGANLDVAYYAIMTEILGKVKNVDQKLDIIAAVGDTIRLLQDVPRSAHITKAEWAGVHMRAQKVADFYATPKIAKFYADQNFDDETIIGEPARIAAEATFHWNTPWENTRTAEIALSAMVNLTDGNRFANREHIYADIADTLIAILKNTKAD